MTETVLHRRGTTLVRRLCLAPGEATPWHRDPWHRVTAILRGAALAIEYRDGDPADRIDLVAGQVDWDEPFDRLHRALNGGGEPYEEITVVLLDRPDAVPQPATGDRLSPRTRASQGLCRSCMARTERSANRSSGRPQALLARATRGLAGLNE